MCKFQFDPSWWGRPTKTNEPISCPYKPIITYDPVVNHDRCIFHLPFRKRLELFPTPQDRIVKYLEAIATEGVALIFCTTIESLNLSTAIKTLTKEIDIQIISSHILGELRLANEDIRSRIGIDDSLISRFNANESILRGGIRVRNSTFVQFDANETTFSRQCSFENVDFVRADIMSSTFESTITFQKPELDGVPIREVHTSITGDACTFVRTPLFMGTTFEQGAMFAGVTFEEAAVFDHADFIQGGTFYDITASIGISFNNSSFEGNTSFAEADLGIAIFLDCKFSKSVIFEKATFGNGFTKSLCAWNQEDNSNYSIDEIHRLAVDHHKARENEFVDHFMSEMDKFDAIFAAMFSRSTIEGVINLRNATLNGNILSERVHFDQVDIALLSPLKRVTMSCDRSKIERGEIRIVDQSCFVQLINATVGYVELSSEFDELFRNIYIDSTNFNGFEFFDYREELRRINWKIDGALVEQNHVPPTKREATYSKAKAGAILLGDQLAQSEFSILEKRYRREKYIETIKSTSDLQTIVVNGLKTLMNALYEGSSRYGQSPQRVLAWSLLLTVVFSIGYNELVDWSARDSMSVTIPLTSYQYALDSLVLSTQSFTSFIVGQPLTDPSTELVTLSSLESFLGAFMIAFFVATIVMRIDK